MTPKSFATPEVLEARRAGLAAGIGFTHWPHEARRVGPPPAATAKGPGWQLPPLTPAQFALVS